MATIQELESFKLSDAVKFHKELNPRLWQDHELDPEVRDQLLLIAEDFVEYLGLDNLKVVDITISGSNAAYSYTPHSDLDLHVLVDFNELPNDPVYQELFTAKKTLYNDAHDINVRNVPVELYVQDVNQPVQSLGEYSILHDKWIRIPKKRRANFDQAATKAKYEKLGDLIELALKTKDPKRVTDTLALIKRYRKSGLDKTGEFGPENLAYKAVRKQGLVQALYDLKTQLHSKKLSIDEAATREDALIKIKKLLQTAGRTPAEKDNIKRIVAKMMHQWQIDPSEVGVRQPVDPLKAKIAKAAYEKTMAADKFKQEWSRFKQGIFAEDEQLDKPELTVNELAKKHNISVEEIKKQLAKGIKVELEHTSHKDVAREIALDHLAEDPKYYDKLAKVDLEESIAYHVTPTRNLRSIMKNGLRPQVGDRSAQLDGEVEGIFLFTSLDDVETAVSSWLGDEFDEDEELSLLAVDITGLEDNIVQGADYETIVNTTISPDRIKVDDSLLLEASGYIPSEKEKNDPRFKTALTVDVKTDSIKKNAKAFNWKTSRAGIPPQANPNGKIAEDLMKEWKSFLTEDQEQQELFPGYDEKHRQERLDAWLGQSHAVSANYKPKVLYHATTKHFDQFRAQNKGFASALGMSFEVDRSGIFLAENPKFALEFIEDDYGNYKEGAVVIPVYLSAQYPLGLTDNSLSPMLNDEALVEEFKENDIDLRSIYYHVYEDQRWELFDGPEGEEFVRNLKKLGYDSAFMYEDSKHLGRNMVWVAFEPSQVKAITNRGSFSPDDPRLMKENG